MIDDQFELPTAGTSALRSIVTTSVHREHCGPSCELARVEAAADYCGIPTERHQVMDKRPAASVVDYLYSLELPDMGPQFEEVARRPAFSSDQQAVTVGAQITEFTSRVPSDIRQAIADGILLAQLAANRHSKDSGADVFGWYDKYVEVLQNIGWQFRDIEFQTQSVSQASGDMHKALIPVVTAMLGPQAAAASIVLSVLGRLEEMDKDKPWITAFERASQHASGAKFQVGYVDAGQRVSRRRRSPASASRLSGQSPRSCSSSSPGTRRFSKRQRARWSSTCCG